MSFTLVDVPQRSPQWFAARLGRLTSTGADAMLATIKSGGYGAGRKNLVARLVLERLTGTSHDSSEMSWAMQQGVEREADATALYEVLTGRICCTAGFLQHDELRAGTSVDGYVGDFEGIVEVKSPLPATHLEYLRTGTIPLNYARQVLHHLWVSGAQWCDWMSFGPEFPEPIRSKLVRVPRDEAAIAAYDASVRTFLAEVDREVDALRTRFGLSEVLQASIGAEAVL